MRLDCHALSALPLTLLLAGGCTTAADDDDDTGAGDDDDSTPVQWVDFEAMAPWYTCPSEDPPAEATVVTAFGAVHQYFGGEDHRTVQAEVTFPEAQDWSQVGLRFLLECPDSDLCDHWDRWGSVQLVLNPGDPEEDWEYLELARHVTPYRKGMCQFIDVTPLAGHLVGSQTLTSFVDTWVGPGHDQGEGWNVTVQFVFYPGPPDQADQVVNIWGARGITVGELDEGQTIADQVEPATVPIPADATRVVAHLTTTGHSFGNAMNCAEFCEMRQDVYVNGELFSVFPWRDDCPNNPVSPQNGTWEYPRNGWCPGAIAVGHPIDVTEAVVPGEASVFDFDIRLANGTEYYNYSPVDLLPYEIVALKIYIYR